MLGNFFVILVTKCNMRVLRHFWFGGTFRFWDFGYAYFLNGGSETWSRMYAIWGFWDTSGYRGFETQVNAMKTVRLVEQMRLAHTHIMLERTYKSVMLKKVSRWKWNRDEKIYFLSELSFKIKSREKIYFSSKLFLALSNYYRAMKSAVFASDKKTQRKWR